MDGDVIMNGEVKWHKATGPAFFPGERWVSSSFKPPLTSKTGVKVVSVRKYPGATSNHISDYGVTYEWEEEGGKVHQWEKDAWNFQVRYTHIADLNL